MAVQRASTYIHALDGRLRVKVTAVKGSPTRAMEIEGQLRTLEGVQDVKANPMTGNVLVLYVPERIGQSEVLGALEHLGSLHEHPPMPLTVEAQSHALQKLLEMLAETFIRSTVEMALQRLVSALI
jgi:copper chaperone CopZ